jgi:hypothetical protein
MSTSVRVTYHGNFFSRNPVGQFHRNAYRVVEDVTEIAASAAASQLAPEHGYLTGALQESIAPRLVKAGRSPVFRGRGRVIAGSRGHEPVRRYAGKIERKYHFLARAARAAQSWADSHSGHIAAMLAKDVS